MECTFLEIDSVEFSYDGVFRQAAIVHEGVLNETLFRFLFDVVLEFEFWLEIWDIGDVREGSIASEFGWKEALHSAIRIALRRRQTLLQLRRRGRDTGPEMRGH